VLCCVLLRCAALHCSQAYNQSQMQALHDQGENYTYEEMELALQQIELESRRAHADAVSEDLDPLAISSLEMQSTPAAAEASTSYPAAGAAPVTAAEPAATAPSASNNASTQQKKEKKKK
jgi:hypothetical protein